MALQINKVELAGNITKDPELRKSNSGVSYCFLTIAQNQKGADGNNKSTFIGVTVWRQAAEFLCKYAHKGDNIWVEGSLAPNVIEVGDKKYTTLNVNVRETQIASSKGAKSATIEEGKAAPEVVEDAFSGVDLSSDDLPF